METMTYNGWKNYETWCISLWIDNEEGSHNYWREVAQECWDAATLPSINAELTGHEPFSREEKAALALADRLKDHYEEEMPLPDSGVWTDLLNAALSEVNWLEIAENMLESVNKADDSE